MGAGQPQARRRLVKALNTEQQEPVVQEQGKEILEAIVTLIRMFSYCMICRFSLHMFDIGTSPPAETDFDRSSIIHREPDGTSGKPFAEDDNSRVHLQHAVCQDF